MTSLKRFLICGLDSITDAFDEADPLAPAEAAPVDSLAMSCGAALTTPAEGAAAAGATFRRPPPRSGLGIGGNRAPPGTVPSGAGGMPGGGPGGILKGGLGGPGGSRTPGGGTPGRSISPGGCRKIICDRFIEGEDSDGHIEHQITNCIHKRYFVNGLIGTSSTSLTFLWYF